MRANSWFERSVDRERAPVAAVDIGPRTARWMVLERSAPGWRVQTWQWAVMPGWVDGGHVMDFLALSDALSLWLAEAGQRRVALSLPPEICDCQLFKPPFRARWWRPGRWLEQQIRPTGQGEPPVWVAHRVAEPAAHWRVVSAPLDRVQDWQGLIEAAGCELLVLEDAHQASWRALERWSAAPQPGAVLLQVGSACVQALREHNGRWHWAWRARQPEQDLLRLGLETALSHSAVFLIGEGDLADALRSALHEAGCDLREPILDPALQVDASFGAGSWSVLGLASLGGRS